MEEKKTYWGYKKDGTPSTGLKIFDGILAFLPLILLVAWIAFWAIQEKHIEAAKYEGTTDEIALAWRAYFQAVEQNWTIIILASIVILTVPGYLGLRNQNFIYAPSRLIACGFIGLFSSIFRKKEKENEEKENG